MKSFYWTVALLVSVAFYGCGLPSRIFTAKVPPPVQKLPAQVEGERRAADLLAHGIQKPESLKPVAQGLSDSLGKPEKPLPSATPEQVDTSAAQSLEALNAGMLKLQKQLDAQNKFLAKYAGKEIEGTGFSLLGPGMVTLVIILIVVAVACPPALTLMFFAFKRLKAAAGIVVNQMEEAGKSPEAAEAVAGIKAKIAQEMKQHPQPTELLKGVITKLKTA